jgi:hypothetical protein
MSSWLNILTNKNTDKEFESKYVKKNDEIIEVVDKDPSYSNQLRDYDEEFDRIYETIINDIHFDFKTLIEDECLPFMDIHPCLITNLNDNFNDFIKNNSYNYNEIIDDVNKGNDLIVKEYENNDEYYGEQYEGYD